MPIICLSTKLSKYPPLTIVHAYPGRRRCQGQQSRRGKEVTVINVIPMATAAKKSSVDITTPAGTTTTANKQQVDKTLKTTSSAQQAAASAALRERTTLSKI